ncbi:putative dj-1 family protein [Phaeomoniella chlamydospora]|uniref:Putative dj-1 family protein n=1 Tax=Phaeomoniella chlamydospora TaxID=158046 RepID=A0A0G2ERH3_PHACM|nr:putative dj-1 family protein [Phaeomoniella chlamydospora]
MAPLRIGIFFQRVQLSDIVGIDLIANCSTEYIKNAAEFGFGDLLPLAVEMAFVYISETLEPTVTTAGVRISPTHTYETAPVDLDILLVGGPPYSVRPPASLEYLRKLKAAMDVNGGTIVSTCVGGMWLADAGILDGRKATTNRGALLTARDIHQSVTWVDQRWVVDDDGGKTKFWTSGGAGCGIDMLAVFAKERFDEKIAMAAWNALDFDPTVRGQLYEDSSDNK